MLLPMSSKYPMQFILKQTQVTTNIKGVSGIKVALQILCMKIFA